MNNPNLPPKQKPLNPNEEMVILSSQEAQAEFDPTKKGKSSGAYTGERVPGLTSAEESYTVGMDATKQLEKDAKNAETKYLRQMGIFMNRKNMDPQKKIDELNRFLAWTNRQLKNTLIKNDELAKKRYEKLQKQAEDYLDQLQEKRAA